MKIFIGILIFSSTLYSQTGTKLEWTQDAPTLSIALSYRYNLGVNGVWQNATLFASCSGPKTPYLCTTTIPATIAPGTHKLTLRAIDMTSIFEPSPSEPSNETDYVKPPPAKPTGVVVKQ